MTNRRRHAIATILLLAVSAWCVAGCQQQGESGAATRPSLATVTAEAETALDAAVVTIAEGRRLGLIPDDAFYAYVAPSVQAANAATLKMEAAAKAGDRASLDTASAAFDAALAQLRPVVAKVSAAKKGH